MDGFKDIFFMHINIVDEGYTCDLCPNANLRWLSQTLLNFTLNLVAHRQQSVSLRFVGLFVLYPRTK